MICPSCESENLNYAGESNRVDEHLYTCENCGQTWLESDLLDSFYDDDPQPDIDDIPDEDERYWDEPDFDEIYRNSLTDESDEPSPE